MNEPPYTLLAPDEPGAVTVERPDGASEFLLTCEHASKRLPRRLGTLGLSEADRERHIAWDIGVHAVARALSERLDATLVSQNYSRLVIDCNRGFQAHDSIAVVSEGTEIPGNRELPEQQVRARQREVFAPFHDRVVELLDARRAAARPTMLIVMHSFTPVFHGVSRPWHIGILYHRDPRLPHLMLELLGRDPNVCVGDNEPYAVSDESDYTVPVHGEKRGLPHVEIEIRQDRIVEPGGQQAWANRLERVLREAHERLLASGALAPGGSAGCSPGQVKG